MKTHKPKKKKRDGFKKWDITAVDDTGVHFRRDFAEDNTGIDSIYEWDKQFPSKDSRHLPPDNLRPTVLLCECKKPLYAIYDYSHQPRILACKECKTAKPVTRMVRKRLKPDPPAILPGLEGDWNDGDPGRTGTHVQGYTQ